MRPNSQSTGYTENRRSVSAKKLARSVQRARWRRQNWAVLKMPLNIGRKFEYRSISPFPLLLESFRCNPVEVAIHEAAEGCRVGLPARRDIGRSRTHCSQLSRKRRSLFFSDNP